MPTTNSSNGRFLCVIDLQTTDLASAAAGFRAKGVTVVSQLDVIGTLIVTGEANEVRTAASGIRGVKSVEAEGVVRTQD